MKFQSNKARTEIKRMLSLLTEENRYVFRLMYPYSNSEDINLVVDGIPDKKIKWALKQVQNTYYGLFKKIKNSDK